MNKIREDWEKLKEDEKVKYNGYEDFVKRRREMEVLYGA